MKQRCYVSRVSEMIQEALPGRELGYDNSQGIIHVDYRVNIRPIEEIQRILDYIATQTEFIGGVVMWQTTHPVFPENQFIELFYMLTMDVKKEQEVCVGIETVTHTVKNCFRYIDTRIYRSDHYQCSAPTQPVLWNL